LREITHSWGPELALSVSCAFSLWIRSGTVRTQHVSNCPSLCQTFLMVSLGDVAIPALISTVELSVGVLAACLPTYRPLFTRITGRTGNTIRGTLQRAGSYSPVKDSIQIPISSHFTKRGVSNPDLDDMEMLAGKTDNKMQTHITNDDEMWHGPYNNEIRVTTSFKTSSS
jgi:hypothetical protein